MSESRLTKLAGLAAIAGIVLIAVANIQLGNPPKADAPAAKVLAFFSDQRDHALAFAYLLGIGILLLTVFGGALRQVLRRAGDTSALPDLVLAATVWVAATDLVIAGAVATAGFRAPDLGAGTAQALYDFSNIGAALLGIPFGVLFGAAGLSALRSGSLPRWIAWLGLATAALNLLKPLTMFSKAGALALNGGLTFVPLVPLWIWTIAVAIRLVRAGAGPATPQPAPTAAPRPAA